MNPFAPRTGNPVLAEQWINFMIDRHGPRLHLDQLIARLSTHRVRAPKEQIIAFIRGHRHLSISAQLFVTKGSAEVATNSPARAEAPPQVLLAGTFGSGKSTLIQQLLGTIKDEPDFPAVSPGRTTVALTTITCTPGSRFSAQAKFVTREGLIRDLRMNLAAASRRTVEGAAEADILRALQDHPDQHLRLSQLFADTEDLAVIAADLAEILRHADRDGESYLTAGAEEALLAGGGLETLTGLFEEAVRTRVDRLLPAGVVRRDSRGWPISFRFSRDNSRDFLSTLSIFAGVGGGGAPHGALLTPLIRYLHVQGGFEPRRHNAAQPLMLVDTPGVGHDSNGSSAGWLDLLDGSNVVVLVDSGTHPMRRSAQELLATVAAAGATDRLVLAMTHMDRVRGGHVATEDDAAAHVWQSVSAAISAAESSIGAPRAERLRARLENHTYYLSHLDRELNPAEPHHEWTVEQLEDLMGSLA